MLYACFSGRNEGLDTCSLGSNFEELIYSREMRDQCAKDCKMMLRANPLHITVSYAKEKKQSNKMLEHMVVKPG